ncbi:unnamed protein product [Triticum turgidum subsp. durum]|uniref:Uncharacterized protein n=1 Tax=Triticum turgidum subsp. durum TaxID=4567 RepID=A0A9R0YQH0_TRITD|nr:unnamed protein product [Triticum turgidum subsp. durum]
MSSRMAGSVLLRRAGAGASRLFSTTPMSPGARTFLAGGKGTWVRMMSTSLVSLPRPWETYTMDMSIDLTKHHVPNTMLDKIAYYTDKSLHFPTDIFFQSRPVPRQQDEPGHLTRKR